MSIFDNVNLEENVAIDSNALSKYRLNNLRRRREEECFSIINRGKLWYNCLTDEQVSELTVWYRQWLDVTETLVIPNRPSFLNDKLSTQEEVL